MQDLAVNLELVPIGCDFVAGIAADGKRALTGIIGAAGRRVVGHDGKTIFGNDPALTDQIGFRRVGRAIDLRMGQQHQITTKDGLGERQCRARVAPEIDVWDGLDAQRLRPLAW